MFIMLAFFTLSGVYLDESMWSRDKFYLSLSACNDKRIEFQAKMDKAIAKDRANGNNIDGITFVCLPNPQRRV